MAKPLKCQTVMYMNLQVTNLFYRITGSGVKLTPFELKVLDIGLTNLPEGLASKVRTQIAQYNLAQRESDWRAINFYKKKSLFRGVREVSPVIEIKGKEAPIIKLKLKVTDNEIIHATFHVVLGRLFCITFSCSTKQYKNLKKVELLSITKSWRSVLIT